MDALQPVSRVLVKDGKWLVPEGQRPANWREILPESPLDAVVQATEERAAAVAEPECEATLPVFSSVESPLADKPAEKPPRSRVGKGIDWESWNEMKVAIQGSGENFGAEPDLVLAALVLFSGMYTRTGPVIRKMTGVRNEKPLVRRCYELGLWNHRDGGVVLGKFGEGENLPEGAEDMEFWLIAMAVNGKIHRNSDGTFQSIKSLGTVK